VLSWSPEEACDSFHSPVPDKVTTCGLPPPSSLNSSEALRAPLALGLNLTLTEQLAEAASVLPQVVVSEKSDLSVPVMAICQR